MVVFQAASKSNSALEKNQIRCFSRRIIFKVDLLSISYILAYFLCLCHEFFLLRKHLFNFDTFSLDIIMLSYHYLLWVFYVGNKEFQRTLWALTFAESEVVNGEERPEASCKTEKLALQYIRN